MTFSLCQVCTDDTKIMVDKTYGARAGMRSLSPNYTNNHGIILHHHELPVKKKKKKKAGFI